MSYAEFFSKVTGHLPFPYQRRLGEEAWPELLDVPTGLGKTAAAVVAWLYKRLRGDEGTGSRLVYCLPMRTLVSQTEQSASEWCRKAAPLFDEAGMRPPEVHVLMGGQVEEGWERAPERPAILIGTQDMLLSRVLNRGFAMSRYKWPVHFALLNNDCLWVFDETQLVGVGIETSAQMQALRHKLGTHGPTHSLWMSATLGAGQLDTVDHPEPAEGWVTFGLGPGDMDEEVVRRRTGAAKLLRRLEGLRLDKDTEKKVYAERLAERILGEHSQRGGLTLVIVNRVPRAQQIYGALRRAEGRTDDNTGLIHARFRGEDRRLQEQRLVGEGDRIVVATQAVEAGVDVSARTMFTELAPWPSLVQRVGRCNRYGDDDAAVFWVDVDTQDAGGKLSLPYEGADLEQARDMLGRLDEMGAGAGPSQLAELAFEPAPVVRPVLRRRDLLDLFDTTPDLCGNDLDVSRYVRDGEDTDVQVYWRELGGGPDETMRGPDRGELCRVSVGAARDFIKGLHRKRDKLGRSERENDKRARLTAWRWNPLDRQWQPADHVFAGQVILLDVEAGGYDSALGWTGTVTPKTPVEPLESTRGPEASRDAMDGDWRTAIGRWVGLRDHLGHVRDEAATLAESLGIFGEMGDALARAGLWHDVGKAHPEFQRKLTAAAGDGVDSQPPGAGPWAKSARPIPSRTGRKHFRHELASALAWLQVGGERDPRLRALIAYLVAAHHGKVRMSLRSVPGESRPPEPERLFARGVWDGDELIALEMPDGARLESVRLDLSVMRMGAGSWLEQMLELRDDPELGPFRMALMESVVRVADWRASAKEQEGGYGE